MSSPRPQADPNVSWVKDRDKPYATLLSYLDTYLGIESDPRGLEKLKRQVSKPVEEQNIDAKTFVKELRHALETHGSELPKDAVFKQTYHTKGDDIDYLRWLWRQLFPDAPVPGLDG